MVDKPDIIKILIEEEKLGKLEICSSYSPEELEVPEELPGDTFDESVGFFSENFEDMKFDVEPAQHGSLSEDNPVDEKELLFQSTNDLMLYLDRHGMISNINKAGIAFSGFSKDEIIGHFFWKIPGVFSKHSLSKYLKVFKNTLKGKSTENFLSELYDKSGKKRVMEFSTYPIRENEKLASILVVAKDVTKQEETENRYRLITENTGDLIFVTTFSLNPKYTYVSPSSEKVMGYLPEDLIGKSGFDFIHPEDRKNLLHLLKKYVGAKGKKIFTGKDLDVSADIEYRAKDKSGDWHYIRSTVNVLGNEMIFVSKDITEHKKADERIASSECKFRSIFENANDAIFLMAEDTFIECNPKTEEMFECDREDILQRKPYDFSPPNQPDGHRSKDEALKNINAALAGKPQFFEWVYKKLDGALFDAEVSLSCIEIEGKVMLQAIVRDVTDRKKAEKYLRDNEQKLSQIVNGNPIPTLVIDKNHTITHWNNALEHLTGLSAKELIGTKKQWKAFYQKERPIFADLLLDAASRKDIDVYYQGKYRKSHLIKDAYVTEDFFPDLGDNGKWLNLSTTLLKDSDGASIGSIETLHDVTERKQAEYELEESYDILQTVNNNLEFKVKERTNEVEKLLKQKDDFITQLSHDLKTPLTPFVSLIPILQRRIEDTPENQRIFETLNKSTKRMKSTVLKIVEYAKLNASVELKLEEGDLSSLINESIEKFKRIQCECPVDFNNMVNDDIEVMVSPFHITSVMSNLFSNAVKYSNERDCSIVIDAKQGEDNEVIVSIKDTGIGLTPEQVTLIFDEFYKADSSRHDLNSSGLGLSICKRIVELHDGKMWVESPGPGKGTTIYFTMQKVTIS